MQLKYATPHKVTQKLVSVGEQSLARAEFAIQAVPKLPKIGLVLAFPTSAEKYRVEMVVASACGFSCVSSWRMAQQAAGEHLQGTSAKLTEFFSVIQADPEAASDLTVFSCVHQRVILGITHS